MQIFRDRLEKLLDEAKDKGRLRKDIAAEIGITPTRLNNYVKTMREPSLSVLCDICRVLGSHPSFLLGFSDDPKWPPEETTMADLAAKMDTLLKSQK